MVHNPPEGGTAATGFTERGSFVWQGNNGIGRVRAGNGDSGQARCDLFGPIRSKGPGESPPSWVARSFVLERMPANGFGFPTTFRSRYDALSAVSAPSLS